MKNAVMHVDMHIFQDYFLSMHHQCRYFPAYNELPEIDGDELYF
jgi:hypothetical protein